MEVLCSFCKVNKASNGFRFVKTYRFISDLCCKSGEILGLNGLLFKIFIDEYETLQEYQQIIINTLIKHSTIPVVFNIGLRPKGMKTPKTISNTETIESPHDYDYIVLGFDEEVYPLLLKKICEKRIQLGKELGKIPKDSSEDIEYYLNNYSIDVELEKIMKSKSNLMYIEELNNLINTRGKEEGLDSDEIEKYQRELSEEAPILNSRMHFALLYKKTQYTPKLRTLYTYYINNSDVYKEWMHNRKNGVIYLLCKETKRKKLYYGFDVYVALSSNIVRYFLELCEYSFRNGFFNDFDWDRQLTCEEQSDAARYVSEYKVNDIAAYEPYGMELRIFVQYLGNIFSRLHSKKDNTLGEPEPNHFNTRDLAMSTQIKKLISSAIMWNVLQEGEATKKKQSKLSPETVDFYLNKIYVPYFEISYRNIRKITLSNEILELLLSGNEDTAKKGLNKYFKVNEKASDIIDNQLSLFDEDGGIL